LASESPQPLDLLLPGVSGRRGFRSPLECDENGFVQTKEVAKARPRKALRRSAGMETIMRQESRKVVDDHNRGNGLYDGIIYIMHTRGTDGVIVPFVLGIVWLLLASRRRLQHSSSDARKPNVILSEESACNDSEAEPEATRFSARFPVLFPLSTVFENSGIEEFILPLIPFAVTLFPLQ
jgi:hypothetical protein